MNILFDGARGVVPVLTKGRTVYAYVKYSEPYGGTRNNLPFLSYARMAEGYAKPSEMETAFAHVETKAERVTTQYFGFLGSRIFGTRGRGFFVVYLEEKDAMFVRGAPRAEFVEKLRLAVNVSPGFDLIEEHLYVADGWIPDMEYQDWYQNRFSEKTPPPPTTTKNTEK